MDRSDPFPPTEPEPTPKPLIEDPGSTNRRGGLLAGRYRLYEPIGLGGMSVVHRGYDTVLDRPVAVKIAHVDDPTFRACLREEARAYGRLNHPRIAQIHDFGESADGQCYIVMELVIGESLAGDVTAGPLDPPAAIRIAAEVAEALAAVHVAGLVHRDVKPDNVIVTADGAKLVDFGISAPVGGPDGDPDGRMLGTPAYVAPERIRDTPVGPACDVYSLGVLLYGMLTGTTPFGGRSRTEVLNAHLTDEPAPMPAIDGLPAGIADLYTACLARDPRDRPTAAEAAAVLAGAAADPAPAAPCRHRRHRLVLAAAGATALSLAAAGWTAGVRRDAGPVTPGTPPAACQVTFAVDRDTGSRFTAALTVTNLGPDTRAGWSLDLTLPSAQRVTVATSDGGRMTVTRTARTTTLRDPAAGTLVTGATAHVRIQATYDGPNLLPTEFRLNDRPCRAALAGAVNTFPAPPATSSPTGTPAPPTTPVPGTTVPAPAVPTPPAAGGSGPTTGPPTTTPPSTPPSPTPTPTPAPSPSPSASSTRPPPPPKPTHSKKPEPTSSHG